MCRAPVEAENTWVGRQTRPGTHKLINITTNSLWKQPELKLELVPNSLFFKRIELAKAQMFSGLNQEFVPFMSLFSLEPQTTS